MSDILRIAVPAPLRTTFDYLPPEGIDVSCLRPGQRLRVPFGRQQAVGLLLALDNSSDIPTRRLKAALEVLDDDSVLDEVLLALLVWASRYYHHPIGDVVSSALPSLLRKGKPACSKGIELWRCTAAGHRASDAEIKRAPRQQALLALIRSAADGMSAAELDGHRENWRAAMKRLVDKGLVSIEQQPCLRPMSTDGSRTDADDASPELNRHQQAAVQQVLQSLGTFQAFLLDGVTGSGKTEVYLNVIAQVIEQGQQALVMVPEISLTPQTVARFQRRFQVPVAVLHSGLNDQQRLCAWLMARSGEAPIIIGTRSSVFTPMRNPGVIIIDEEHDVSLKQQDGFRYHARDVAIVRARNAAIPILMGSATPALESLYNVDSGRYRRLELPERVGGASTPPIHVLDVRQQPMDEGLSGGLLQLVNRHLEQNGQVLLFLNRRGYAPTMLCHDCGWMASCHRCDARMTLHQLRGRLSCHHCGHEQRAEQQCPDCGGPNIIPLGHGTERIEQALKRHFPDIGIARVDRDSTRRKGAMEGLLNDIKRGKRRLLIGTQMLAKGHHFPDVSLVGILDVDQGLFSADFRASERMAQLIVQVAGRAGRANRPGEVYLQTHHPQHPLLHTLITRGYEHFARQALQERQQAGLPPYSHMILIRAEASDRQQPHGFLQQAIDQAASIKPAGVSLLGPLVAPMEKRAGRYRAQLLIEAKDRARLHGFLSQWLPLLEGLKSARKVRWSVDVDPADMM